MVEVLESEVSSHRWPAIEEKKSYKQDHAWIYSVRYEHFFFNEKENNWKTPLFIGKYLSVTSF